MTFKRCSNCGDTKPQNAFSKNKAMKDGYNNNCKSCLATYHESKGKVSKGEAIKYVDNLVNSGELFRCKGCGEDKLADKFYHQRSYGSVKLATTKCKSCQSEYQRLKTFGLTLNDFNSILKAQGNMCAICDIDHDVYKSSSYKNKCFAVDHCHTTGVIRGLLCEKCNRALGYFNDNREYLLKAVSYLEGDDIV